MTKFILKGFDCYGDHDLEYPEYIKEFDTFEDMANFIDNDEGGVPVLTYFVYSRDKSGKDYLIDWNDYYFRKKLLPPKMIECEDWELPF